MSQQSWEIYTPPEAPGPTTTPNIKAGLRAAMNMHYGTSRPSYLEAGGVWCRSTDDVLFLYDGTNDIKLGYSGQIPSGTTRPSEVTTGGLWYDTANSELLAYDGTVDILVFQNGRRHIITSGTTIDVSKRSVLTLNYSAAETITDFTNARAGQIITLWSSNSNATIDGNLTKSGMTIPLISGDTMQFIYDVGGWMQIGGSVGMGSIQVACNVDNIGDWISTTTTSETLVDVSDDSVRKGAKFVLLQVLWFASGPIDLYTRKDTSVNGHTHTTSDTSYQRRVIQVELTNDATFLAYFSGTATVTSASVVGYII